jgi:hypothetical protein
VSLLNLENIKPKYNGKGLIPLFTDAEFIEIGEAKMRGCSWRQIHEACPRCVSHDALAQLYSVWKRKRKE